MFLLLKNAFGEQLKLTLFYSSGKFEIGKTDSIKLDSIAKVILNSEKYSFKINSFCDSDGSLKDNYVLAENRCKSVKSILVNSGLNNDSIICNTIGELKNTKIKLTEAEKSKSRRTDIEINYIPKTRTNGNDVFAFSEKDLIVGKKLVLPTINFVNGTADFLVTSYPSLLELLKVMKKYPTLEIEIGGHVCCSNNFPISEKRAYNVFAYLQKNGDSSGLRF